MIDYLGNVCTAMRRYDALGPGVVSIRIETNCTAAHRYWVLLWNGFGRWEASSVTLADSIHLAIDRGVIDRFGFDVGRWNEIADLAERRAREVA